MNISDLRENDKCLRRMVQFIQGNTNTNVHIVKKKLKERIDALMLQNHDLQKSFIEMQKDKSLFRDMNEALEIKVTDLGCRIVTLENRLRYS